jgi:PKD repeat protein
MRNAVVGAFLVLGLATSGVPGEKVKKPRLDLRASPRVAFSPVNVLLTAELRGGDPAEEYYCPEVEWDWDDGGKSARESDCPPLEANGSFERRFTAEHAYRQAGNYTVKVTMRHANKPLAVATATVTVRAGLGDMSEMD